MLEIPRYKIWGGKEGKEKFFLQVDSIIAINMTFKNYDQKDGNINND